MGENAPAEVLAKRQQLKDHAYYLVIKSMICKGGAPDMTLLTKLRMELGIGPDSHRKWLSELMQSKKNNTLSASVPSTTVPAVQAAPAPRNRVTSIPSSSQAVPARAPALQPQSQQPQQQYQEAKGDKGGNNKKKKMKLLSGAAPAVGLMPEYIGRKVKRFWARDQDWFDGVITDYKPSNGQYCITYDLGTKNESFEWLDTQAYIQNGDLRILNERVDLRSYPNSRAVQSSSVINPKRPDGGSAAKKKAGSEFSIGPTGRKRTLAAYEDSDDMNDML